ncbi:MAG: DUF192 domain-containing protein [Gaiellaceae bacterium]
MTSRLPRTFALLAAAITGAVAVAMAGASPTATPLRLDGVPFRPELALTSASRSLGLMNRRRAPADGMLFVFPEETTGGFWMKNTLVPLTIAFFDAQGKRVRKLSMTPCRQESCPIYSPGRRYRFALELRASDTRHAAKLGPLAELRRLGRIAS